MAIRETREVVIDVVASEGEADVIRNMKRKEDAADLMFDRLVSMMHDAMRVEIEPYTGDTEEVPSWL